MRTRTLLTLALSVSSVGAFAQFTAGKLVVSQIGNGTSAIATTAARVTLREFSTAGVASGFEIAVPFSNATNSLTNRGTSTSEAFLTRSTNGQYLMFTGYNAVEGTTDPSASTTVPRVLARANAAGTLDISTVFTDGYLGSSTRSAASDDGSRAWMSGTSSPAGTGGIRSIAFGGSTSTSVYDAAGPNNSRVVNIFDLGTGPKLYMAAASGSFIGISEVGSSPLSVLNGQTATLLPGMPGATTGPSPYDFYFSDADTLYVSDDRTIATGGGIQKWTQSGGTWTLAYTMNVGLANGARALTATKSGSVVTLYATTAAASANKIVTVTDNGAASPFTDLVTAPANTVFRGLEFAPVAGGNSIAGTFIDAGFSGSWSAFGGTYEIRSGATVVNSGTFSLGASGTYSFTLPASVANGNYDLCIKVGHWLSKKIAINLNGNLSGVDVSPINGDVDGDDSVSILDYSVLSDSFDKTLGDSGYVAAADLDGDDSVTILDYSILSDNFDLFGECL